MPRPRQITDKEILAGARAAFLEHGASLSTTAIAEALGVSQAVLFQRFGTKERLLIAALAPNPRPPWVDRFENGPDDSDIREQLLDIATEFTSYFEEVVPCITVLHEAGLGIDDVCEECDAPPPLQIHRILASWLERAASRGLIETSNTQALALAFQGALQIRPFLSHIAPQHLPKKGREGFLKAVVEVFWAGMHPTGQEHRA